MTNPYGFADKIIVKLKKRISAEFANATNAMPFDELNVLSVRALAKSLYEVLRGVNNNALTEISRNAYRKAYIEAQDVANKSEDGDIDAIVSTLLSMYHPVTEYSYNKESLRKRDRLIESILAAGDMLAMRNAYNRAANLWLRQSTQYADLAVDEARTRAFKDAGISHVEWVALHDDRVCSECNERNGMIFPIDHVPSKPHRRCRCWLRPVRHGT